MPDSRQLDVLKRLTDHLKGIVPSNGYDFDISDSVFRGRHTYGDTDPSPLISIVEHLTADVNVDMAAENRIMRAETWVLLVQGWLRHGADNPTDDAYNLKAAVEHRLARLILLDPSSGNPKYPAEYRLGIEDTITDISIGPGVVSVAIREGGSSRAFFYLPVGIGLALNVSDPFVS